MNETPADHDRLLDEAIDLIIRHQNDPGNPVASEMIRAWRARGPRHEETWARIANVHGASGILLNEKRRIERRESLGLTRRNVTLGGVAILAAGAAASTWGPGLLVQARADHVTAKGEIRSISLPDGSVATLGPESAIALDFRERARAVSLIRGMSYFEVARDPARPFSVSSGALRGIALGTAFDVSNDAGVVTLAVDHGLVEVRAGDVLDGDTRLATGEWISFDSSSSSIDRGRREQVAAWRDNVIIAERESVSALVARIGRWIPGRVVIADPFIGRQRVSGLFDLNDPVRALEAVVHPAGGHVRRMSSLVTVVSPL